MNLPGETIEEPKERGDLADPKKVGRRETLDKLRVRQEQEDILFILSSVQGRRFYWRMMERCGIFESSFTGNNTTFFNEGQRNIGLMLLSKLNEISPQSYLQMIHEAKYEESKRS
jgi:hypothetical protein